MPPESRDIAIDRVKAWAILAVILTHATVRIDIAACLIWEVPAFFLVAGMLYRTQNASTAVIIRRLTRLLTPYVVASLIVFAVGPVPALPDLGAYGWALLTANALNIYYFVFVMTLAILAIYPLSRATGQTLIFITGCAVTFVFVAPFAPALQPMTFFWGTRDPFGQGWLAFFLLGWIGVADRAMRAPLAIALPVAVTVILLAYYVPVTTGGARLIASLAMLPVLARLPLPGLTLLSTASLALYLWHHVFQLAVRRYVPGIDAWSVATMFAVGLAGSFLVVIGTRSVLGPERARRWIGA
jgi:peptidoglycan/LPS O-acetylase OafA/YrhL